MPAKLCLPSDVLCLTATGRGSWTEVLEGAEDRLRGEGVAPEGWESSLGWCPQRASKPAERPAWDLGCDPAQITTEPGPPRLCKAVAWDSEFSFSTEIMFGGLVLSLGHRSPPHLVRQCGVIVGAQAQALPTAPHSHPSQPPHQAQGQGREVLKSSLGCRLRTDVLGRQWERSVFCEVG